MKIRAIVAAVLLGLVGICSMSQAAPDVPLYRFGNIPSDTGLYKMVYQGCEIFVAVGESGHTGELSFKDYPKSISIATGRNCR